MFDRHNYEFALKMLSACYPLDFWEYSPDMKLLSSTSFQMRFMDQLLTVNGMRSFLIDYVDSKATKPFELTDDLGILIGGVISQDDFGCDRILLMGPIFTNDRTLTRIQKDLRLRDLSVSSRKSLFSQLEGYPIIPANIFWQYILMFAQAVCGKTFVFDDILHKNFSHAPSLSLYKSQVSAQTKYFQQALSACSGSKDSMDALRHATYRLNDELSREHAGVSGFEQQLLAAVEQGNIGLLNLIHDGARFSDGIQIQLESDLQRSKYSSISLLTLCSRAAIRGGLSPSIAYSLMDTYTLAVDNCASSNDIMHINDTLFADYITRVHDAKQNSNISVPIRTCVDYINLHIRDKITIDTLARETGYSNYYLSHKFKEEMGVNINQYIQKEKLKIAKVLLKSDHTSITEVSEALHFCSQSYFSNLFQKEYGLSPSQYLNQ